MMSINELKPGYEIEIFKDSAFCINDNFDISISDLTWKYKITYVDSDYIVVNLLYPSGASPYLLGNCKSIKRLEL